MLRRGYIILYISVVLVIEEGVGDDRQGTAISGFTTEDITALLNIHNEYRRLSSSSNMRILTWSKDLEGMAQGWVDMCIFGHNPDTKNRFGFSNVGENFYISQADTYAAEEAVESWHEEILDYNYTTMICNPGRVCGHYTQVIWADSYELGCGITWCNNISDSFPGFEKGLIIVCNYGPAGNFPNRKPYEAGQPCTDCPNDAQVCTDGLCAISTQTTSTATTTPKTSSTPSTTTSTTTTLSTTTSTTTTPSTTTSTTTAPTTDTALSTSTITQSMTSSTQTNSAITSSSSVSSSSPTTTKTGVSGDTASTESTTAVDTGGVITTTTEPTPTLDFETEITQTFVIFAFVAASVSACFIFNTLRSRFNRKEEEKSNLSAI